MTFRLTGRAEPWEVPAPATSNNKRHHSRRYLPHYHFSRNTYHTKHDATTKPRQATDVWIRERILWLQQRMVLIWPMGLVGGHPWIRSPDLAPILPHQHETQKGWSSARQVYRMGYAWWLEAATVWSYRRLSTATDANL